MSEKEKEPTTQNGGGDKQKSTPPDSTDPKVRDAPPGSSSPSLQPDTHSSPLKWDKDTDLPPRQPKQKVELDLEGLRKEHPPESETPIRPVAPMAKNRRPIALILILVTLLLGGFWLAYQSIKNRGMGGSPGKGLPQNVSAGFNAPVSAKTAVDPSFGLAPFFVPIPGDEKGRDVFLKMTVSLAFTDRVPSDEIGRKNLMIRSEITDILLRRHLGELRSIEGKMVLKHKIRDAVNRRLTQGTVRNVYFEEFFML